MIDNNKRNILIYTVNCLVALLIVTYAIKSIFFSNKTQIVHELPKYYCNINSMPCLSEGEHGEKIFFSILPVVKLPNLTNVILEVQTSNIRATKVAVDINSINKYMIANKPTLNLIKSNHFIGNTVLPKEEKPEKEMIATVSLKTDKGTVLAPFIFNRNSLNSLLEQKHNLHQ